jgi:hypothetical protein
MKFNARLVLEDLIAEGITLGYRRSFKHNDKPTEEEIKEHIETAIWEKMHQYLNFDDDF